ncbi:PstS family phosphate ABC transporter substrate-binding protein [Plasticicumulans sp.]|uniref:PstS family phosphate ABC transporter substrate-binding protein n=1 Tax=Plasticicumulans sp. TaxID=2307179 RepID=UPI003954493C
MNKPLLALAVTASLAAAAVVQAQSARDYISVVGSSTVYPFTTVVAEQFGKSTKFKTPKIESTGTGGGFKLFCAGVGPEHPDVSNASRAIKTSEIESCAKNGVTDIVEVKIGYDGIVFANAKGAPWVKLTRAQIYLALAKTVPDPKDPTKLVANPYQNWSQIDAGLPNAKIEVLGPPPTSGTRDAFVELVMDHGCEAFPAIKALKDGDPKQFKAVCQTMREDGSFIEAGENDNLIVQKLVANKSAFGIFGYSFMEENLDKVQGSIVEGHSPTFEEIAAGKYPIARPLFFYVKKAHVGVIPGLKEFVNEFVSEKSFGTDGYLADKGLIPLPDAERKSVTAAARELKTIGSK